MRSIARFGFALLSLGLLSGCAATGTVVATAENLCRDWQHQKISKNDKLTDGTASQIEANNKSRPTWGCAYGRNEEAKS